MVWSLYFVSVLVGLSAAILWTGEGAYLASMSDATTVSRNAGVFWALMQVR